MLLRSQLAAAAGSCPAFQALFTSHYCILQSCLNTATAVSRSLATAAQPSSDSRPSSSSNSTSADASQHTQSPLVYAACVLERLPIVKTPPPEWEVQHKAQAQLLQLQTHELKQYPMLDGKQQREAASKEAAAASEAPASFSTAADESGAVNTMKRRLQDKLVLLVRTQGNALPLKAAAAAVASGSASGKDSSSSSGAWTFPHTAHQAGETIRQAAERALKETIGLSQVYFVGNAPMAHLDIQSSTGAASSSSSSKSEAAAGSSSSSSSSSTPATGSTADTTTTSSSSSGEVEVPSGRMFFHLAQVVNDPWDVQLSEGAASDVAWVAKEELGTYIKDLQLLKLARKML